MLPTIDPDRVQIAFDDKNLLANAGLLLPITPTDRLDLGKLANERLDLGAKPGRANVGDKLLTLVCSALAGKDCTDDADVLRAGDTARILEHARFANPVIELGMKH